MLTRKYLKMGISSVVSALIIAACPIMAFATGVDEMVVFGSGSSAADNGDLVNYGVEAEYEIDEDAIWGQIDRDDLRSFVDAEAILESIDKTVILENMDMEALLAEIDEDDLARQVDSDQHPIDVVNTKMPLIGEESPFDFIIDPLGLIYSTDAAKYGGGRVEEGATVLFKNTQGEYLFSSSSDVMTVVNRGNVPIRLTVKATVSNAGGLEFVSSRSELEGPEHSIFMALCDEDGIGSVITEYGEASIELVLGAAPDDTYSFVWNEDKEKYDYTINEDVSEDVFDSFSFYIYADCNTDAEWGHLEQVPMIQVTWSTEAIEPDKDEFDQEVELYESDIENMVADYLETNASAIIAKRVYPTSAVEDIDKEREQAEVRIEKIAKLRKEELIKLASARFKADLEEEVNRLIDDEVELMAMEQFEEIKAAMIRELMAFDEEEAMTSQETIIDTEEEVTGSEEDAVESDANVILYEKEDEKANEPKDEATVITEKEQESEPENSASEQTIEGPKEEETKQEETKQEETKQEEEIIIF
jgi:hypothetical protein